MYIKTKMPGLTQARIYYKTNSKKKIIIIFDRIFLKLKLKVLGNSIDCLAHYFFTCVWVVVRITTGGLKH